MRFALPLLALVAAAAVTFALWYWPNRPQPVSHPWTGGPIESLSFAPFHDHQSPLTHSYPTPAEIDADLKALQGRALGVRTYTSLEGLNIVPAIAAKYGLQVIQSAWLGVELPVNDAEVAALIDLANRYPDTIKRVIVGNEVLLRHDLTSDQLIGYIRRVKAAVRQPVSYADVWEYWLKHPEIAKEVDFITIHMLPYWEDVPIGVPDAQAHILAVYRQVQAAFPGKPIAIGEVGWPSAGRSREGAVPGRREAAQFLNDFLNLAAAQHLDYNYVEAYDQPWKTALEGTMGGNWGLFEPNGQPKFAFAGPVSENPEWPIGAAASLILGVGGALWLYRRRPQLAAGRLAAAIILAQALAAMLTAFALHAARYSYGLWEQMLAVLWFAWAASLAWQLQRDFLSRLEAPASPGPAPFRDVNSMLAERQIGEWLLLAAAPLALYQTVMLDFAGRYRDFPINAFLVPAFGFQLSRLLAAIVAREPGGWLASFAVGHAFRQPSGQVGVGVGDVRRERLTASALLVSAATLVILESPSNHESDYWALAVVAIALPYAVAWLTGRIKR